MTSARPDATGDKINLINIPGASTDPVGVNRIPNTVVEFYISLADNQIDGKLSQMYVTPLAKVAHGQWSLDADINEYNQILELSSAVNLVPGDQIIIRDDATGIEELHTILTVLDQNRVTTVDPIVTFFSGSTVRVFRLQFPPPINQCSARYAASFIYDKFFAAQSDPNMSEFGNELRNLAMGDLNDILNGRAILKGQQRIGDRFGNPWLDDLYALRDRGFDATSRDLSQPK